MKVLGRFDLTYCSNIHAGESWAEVRRALGAALPEVRQHLGAAGPLAIGLRLSSRAAEEIEQPAAFDEFRAVHARRRLLRSHHQRISVWRLSSRARQGKRLPARLARSPPRRLHEPAGDAAGGTARRAWSRGGQRQHGPRRIQGPHAGAWRRRGDCHRHPQHAGCLAGLRESTGITIALAIEPEPACFIETAAEAVDFFTRYLFDAAFVRSKSQLTVDDVRRHVGICFDACHMAVEFEDHAAALDALDRAGIRVPKFQISSALRVRDASAESPGRRALARFAEDTYLHQVVARSDDGLVRHVELPDALASASTGEWRIHFHVPVFLRAMGDLETTQPDLETVLDLVKNRADAPCLEVETYTWDVLPPEYRTAGMSEAIARELAWTRQRLEA